MRTARLVFASLTLCPVLLFGIERNTERDNVKEDFHHTYDMQPGGRLEVSNFNGSVEVTGWDQNSIDISGAKYAESQELLKAIRIDVSVNSGVARIRSIRPDGLRGNMGVRYIIKVPRRTALDTIASSNGSISVAGVDALARLRTSNGAVKASQIKGNVDVQTSNGSVQLADLDGDARVSTSNGGVNCARIRGTVNAATTNGGVQVDLAENKSGEPVRVTTSNGGVNLKLGSTVSNPVHAATTNGGITVQMPADTNARVRAVVSSHGKVSSDFDVRREGPESRTKLEGQIGNGGALIELTTSNGGIHLKKL